MGFDTTIDFIWKPNIDIQTSGREHYKLSIILAITGGGIKLRPLVIVKGESGKTIENELWKLYTIPEGYIFIYAQKDGWCTTFIFKEWINNVFKKYEKMLGCKCILIMDRASNLISKESINFLEENNIAYNLIPAGLTQILQPLDISVNKVFKDNIKNLFERGRLFLDNLNKNLKLKTACINLIDNIKKFGKMIIWLLNQWL